jgi:hypothetical protein
MLYYNNVYEVNVDDCVCVMVPNIFIKKEKLGGVVYHCVICVYVCVCVFCLCSSVIDEEETNGISSSNKQNTFRVGT